MTAPDRDRGSPRDLESVQIQAAIATFHGLASDDADTDWPQIVDLYRMLERIAPGSITRINRAVAESKVFGPAHALDLLAGAEEEGWHLYWATRAELLLQQSGRNAEARVALERAGV